MDPLKRKVQGALNNFHTQIANNVVNKVAQAPQPIRSAINNTANFVQKNPNFVASRMASPLMLTPGDIPTLYGQQKFKIPRVDLQSKINTGNNIRDGAFKLAASIPEMVINAPSDYQQGIGKISQGKVLQGVGQAGMGAFNIATMGGGTIAKDIGANVVKGVGYPAMKMAIKQGAANGAIYGGGFGSLSGLASSDNLKEQLKQVAIQGGGGIVAGAALGGTVGLAGNRLGAFKAAKLSMEDAPYIPQLRDAAGRFAKGQTPIKPKGMPTAQWKFQIKFNEKYKRNPYEPVFPSTWEQSIKQRIEDKGVGLSIKDVSRDPFAPSTKLTQNQATELLPSQKTAQGVGRTNQIGQSQLSGQLDNPLNTNIAQSSVPEAGLYDTKLAQEAKKYKNADEFAAQFTPPNGKYWKTENNPFMDEIMAYKNSGGKDMSYKDLYNRVTQKNGIIKETDGGIGKRNVGDLNTGQGAIPHKEINRSGSRPTMLGANPSSVTNSRPSQLVRVGESDSKLTGVPSSEMPPGLLSRESIPQSRVAQPTLSDATSPLQKVQSEVLPQEPQQVSTQLNGSNVKQLSEVKAGVQQPQSQVVSKAPTQQQLPKPEVSPSEDIISKSYNYNKLDQAYTESLDRFHPISKLGKAAKKNDVIQNALTGHYGSGSIAKYHLDFELAPILKKNNPEDFKAYLIAQRDIEQAGKGLQGSNMGDPKKILEGLKAKNGSLDKLESAAQEYYTFKKNLVNEYLVDTGIMSKDSAKAMFANNQRHTPFKRVMDQVDDFLGIPQRKQMGSVGSQNVIKKYKGSDKEIVDPIESEIENVYKIVGLGQRQKVARAIVSLKDDLPKGMVREFKGESLGNNPVISLFENGKVKKYTVPREVEQAAKGLNEDQLGTLVKILSAPTKIFRASATTLNPEFMIPNVARDLQSAFVNVGLNPLRFASGVAHFIKKDEVYKNFLKSGGMTSFTSLDRKFFKETATELSGKGITIKKPSDLLRIIQNVGAISEQPTRIAAFDKVYNQALKSGKSVEEARSMGAYAAQEATVNFGRRGSKTQSLNAVFAFLNARLQGLDRTARSLKNDPVGAGTRLGLVVMAPGMATYAWNQQFPDYYNERIVTKNDKQNNFIIMLPSEGVGGARFIKIPKGDIGKMFNPVEAFMDYAKGQDTDIRNAVDSMLKGFSPVTNVGDLVPTALRPIVEDKANKNFFFDSPIVPEYQKKDQPRDQFRSFTPSIYRAIGDKTNLSPARLQNITEGYGTGWAKIGSNVAEKFINNPDYKREDRGSAPINSTPIARRFLGGAKYSEEEFKKVDSYNKKQKVEKQIQKTGKVETTDSEVFYKDANGDLQTFKLTPDTKGTGIGALSNTDWIADQAAKLHRLEGIDDATKNDIYKKWGITKEDARYADLASYNSDVSAQYLEQKSQSHDELINNILTGRVVSISDQQFADNGTITKLNEQGLLSDAEAKALKKIKIDKDGQDIGKAIGKASGKVKKIKVRKAPSFKAAKAPKFKFKKVAKAKTKKMAQLKVQKYKIPKKPKLS
jgi:hypothetical protein